MSKKAEQLLTYIGDNSRNSYSDGDETENYLLNLFRNGLSDERRRQILQDNPTWPIRYHLTFERRNLLSWYPFAKKSSILEVGAGCGGITESLVQKDVEVTSVELSKRRALINATRNSEAKNLKIIVGNLNEFSPKNKYDYVVCVGVLEYAAMFGESKEPYKSFIKKMHGFLNPGGKLLIAIENQMGIKYFAGAIEDHVAKSHEGINDYPGQQEIRTFGRTELKRLLKDCGFTKQYFYYPFPDYKVPTLIYSDDYYPGKDDVIFPKYLLPTPQHAPVGHEVFSEESFAGVVERNGLFREFANSFLVEVTADE